MRFRDITVRRIKCLEGRSTLRGRERQTEWIIRDEFKILDCSDKITWRRLYEKVRFIQPSPVVKIKT